MCLSILLEKAVLLLCRKQTGAIKMGTGWPVPLACLWGSVPPSHDTSWGNGSALKARSTEGPWQPRPFSMMTGWKLISRWKKQLGKLTWRRQNHPIVAIAVIGCSALATLSATAISSCAHADDKSLRTCQGVTSLWGRTGSIRVCDATMIDSRGSSRLYCHEAP